MARDKNEAINSYITDMLALEEDGLPVRADVLPEISRTIEEVWRSESAQAPQAEEVSVGPRR